MICGERGRGPANRVGPSGFQSERRLDRGQLRGLDADLS